MTMTMTMLPLIAIALAALALIGSGFNLAAAILASRYRRQPCDMRADAPAVTVLKPLHGAEPALAANLASAFAQGYDAPVQIVAGLRDADDPARSIIAATADDYPGIACDIVVDNTRHGINNKLSNMINMTGRARHPVIVLADSDVAWPADTLAQLTTALAEPGVGLVSCLHVGRGDAGFWSRLAAMDISYRFMPSVIVGTAAGLANPALGPTMALRRETLDRIGGFTAFKDMLADDYEIGRAVRALGLRTVIPPFFIVHSCPDATLAAVIAHELRWSVTIYRIDPYGFAGSFVTHCLPLALLAALAAWFSLGSLAVVAVSLVARCVLKLRMDAASGAVSGPVWLLPLRDLLSFGIFCATFFARNVHWRGARFRVTGDGRLHSNASS